MIGCLKKMKLFCLICNPNKTLPYKLINGKPQICCSEKCWNHGAISIRRNILESECLLNKSSKSKGLQYIYGYFFGWKLSQKDIFEIDEKIKLYKPFE